MDRFGMYFIVETVGCVDELDTGREELRLLTDTLAR